MGALTAIAPTKPSASKACVIVRMILSLTSTLLVFEGVCHNDNARLDYRVPCGSLYKIRHKTQTAAGLLPRIHQGRRRTIVREPESANGSRASNDTAGRSLLLYLPGQLAWCLRAGIPALAALPQSAGVSLHTWRRVRFAGCRGKLGSLYAERNPRLFVSCMERPCLVSFRHPPLHRPGFLSAISESPDDDRSRKRRLCRDGAKGEGPIAAAA
jgi:hypothetical protein